MATVEKSNKKVTSMVKKASKGDSELTLAKNYLSSLSVVKEDSYKGLVSYLGDITTARLLRDTKTVFKALVDDLNYNWDKSLLNTPKGVFNVKKGILEPRNQRYFRQITNDYDEKATAPNFYKFLDSLNSDKNPSLANDLLAMIAYSVFGENNQKFFVILHGKGNDGKTTLQTAIQSALGSYASKIQISALTYVPDRRFNPALGQMDRARYFFASELNENILLDHSLLKEITSKSNAILPYETKGSNQVSEAHINGILTLDSNYMPLLKEADPAVLRRIATFEFYNSIDKVDIDPNLIEKLKNESAGILNLIIANFDPNWKMPEKYFDKTTELMDEQTNDKEELIDYLLDETIIYTNDSEDKVRQAELHSQYRLKNNGIKPKDIKKSLFNKNIQETKYLGTRYYTGIKLKFSSINDK